MKQTKSKIIGYIRISTEKQDLENQKHQLQSYCYEHQLKIDDFIEIQISSRRSMKERRIDELLNKLTSEDTLIVTELSRIGRSIGQIILIVNTLVENKINFICIKENIRINGKMDITSKTMVTMIGLFAEIERDLISRRITDALKVKKSQGVILGRKKGTYSSKLDTHKKEIVDLKSLGLSVIKIAEKFGVTRSHMSNYINHRLKLK